VFFAIEITPIVSQVFSHERLAAVGTMRGYMILIAFWMIGLSVVGGISPGKRLLTVSASGSYVILIALWVI
jgi:hypothetical protein